MAEVIRIEVEFTPEATESGKDEVMHEVSQKNLMLLAGHNDVFQVRIDSYEKTIPDPKDIDIRELRKDLKKISIAYLAAIEVIENPGSSIALLEQWTAMEDEARMIVNA